MPPKRRGRPPKRGNVQSDVEEVISNEKAISNGDTSDSSVDMVQGTSAARGRPSARGKSTSGKSARGRGKGKAPARPNAIPDVYQSMLADALPAQGDATERPLKRRRVGPRNTPRKKSSPRRVDDMEEEEEEPEFEDVLYEPPSLQQTATRGSDEESEDDEVEYNGVDFEALPEDEPSGDLELNLTVNKPPQRPKISTRRRVVSKDEKVTRLEIHRMNVLCLLSHLDQRNNWCNDPEVQDSLRPLLDKKMLKFLRPKPELPQFGRAESVKRGLEQVADMWRKKYKGTSRGMRRALWADNEKDLQDASLELPISKEDFRNAAKRLKGSRDLGAQLYCALLRSAGVETRLVCSLQPLSFNAGGPTMPKSVSGGPRQPVSDSSESEEEKAPDVQAFVPSFNRIPPLGASGSPFSPRRRLGHPNAADYHMPDMSAPARPPPRPKKSETSEIHESSFPVFWVEVLDEAHQKWMPVDPLITGTIAKPRVFEPPALDRENNMTYVIAFGEDGSAKDVTRRYAKAYNSKTRRNRMESTPGGDKWFRKAMKPYSPPWQTDLDQIEDTELAATEAKEPMPKNIIDFKDHPTYALERHLRRHEILTSTHAIGKVAAGRDTGTPGGKKLENVYRRRDVKIARSADAWYRMGRDLKMGEQPMKTLPAKGKPDEDLGEAGIDDRPGTNLYTEEQTELYESPPVVNGRVPKNSFGNIDVYVPTMVPKGGVHLPHDEALRAARILDIDFAPALSGFDFKGRHGTPVFRGVVVASEFREAVEAVIEGFRYERDIAREGARSLRACRAWKRFLVGLRIKARVDGYAEEGEDDGAGEKSVSDDEESDDYVDEDGGGGFVPDDDYDEDEGGGFIP